jgi:hypothetical protein
MKNGAGSRNNWSKTSRRRSRLSVRNSLQDNGLLEERPRRNRSCLLPGHNKAAAAGNRGERRGQDERSLLRQRPFRHPSAPAQSIVRTVRTGAGQSAGQGRGGRATDRKKKGMKSSKMWPDSASDRRWLKTDKTLLQND